MDISKVVIENWPKANYFSVYIPIFIAIIALCISLYSVYVTRKIFIESNRPYVWASNYISEYSTPLTVACHVINSPARIIQVELKMNLNMEALIVYKEKDVVRFPNEMYRWDFDMSYEEFDKIRKRASEEESKLVRIISLEYSSLDIGIIYHYILEQSYNISEGEWENINEKTG